VSDLRERVIAALSLIKDPFSGKTLLEADLVKALSIDGKNVRFVIEVDANKAEQMEPVRLQAEQAVSSIEDVEQVMVGMVAHNETSEPPKMEQKPTKAEAPKIAGVKKIIAVGSGKGGVGKSTVTANLACAFAAKGLKVGILDADIYGPSQPRMMDIADRPSSPDGKKIMPLQNYGITMMSIGLMIDEAKAIIWRGPMLMGALQQLISHVQWGELDLLLIDLPPGTGDVQLSLSQKAKIDGAIIVSTPQDIALLDARKAIDMFNQIDVPILGMIENMSTYICSQCGHEEAIFGHGGAEKEAQSQDIEYLGPIPLDLSIRLAADEGKPIVLAKPESQQAKAFHDIAKNFFPS